MLRLQVTTCFGRKERLVNDGHGSELGSNSSRIRSGRSSSSRTLVVVEVVWSWAGKEQLLVFTAETADRDNHCGDALMMVVG